MRGGFCSLQGNLREVANINVSTLLQNTKNHKDYNKASPKKKGKIV